MRRRDANEFAFAEMKIALLAMGISEHNLRRVKDEKKIKKGRLGFRMDGWM